MSIEVLRWRYKKGSDVVLNYIASGCFDSRSDIAKEFGVSVKTVGRWISTLKKQGLLVIHRYKNNNFIYLVGRDAIERWNSYEARHVAVHRKYKFNIDEISVDDSIELPLFKDEEKDARQHDGYYNCDAGKDFVKQYSNLANTYKISDSDREWLDLNIGVTI